MIILFSIIGFVIAYVLGHFTTSKLTKVKISEAEQQAKNLIKDAEYDAKNIKKEQSLEAKEFWHKKKQEFESERQSKRDKLTTFEKKLQQREEALNQKLNVLQKKEQQVQGYEQQLTKKETELGEKFEEVDKIIADQTLKLEKVAGLSKEEAKQQLIDQLTNEARSLASHKIRQIKEDAKLTAQKEAASIVVQAIQRTASDHSTETTVAVVNLDSDEMKGRIIGREGRNIRSFEAATGIDLIIDDTPEAVVISGFDPFRREVAKVSLEKLMLDGRIHPTRIEEVVEKSKIELENDLSTIGENTLLELGIHKMHRELLRYIGRMKYRTSYGQNLLKHSIEVAYLASIMAAELGLDVEMAKRAALLHDIGKCVEKDPSPHALIGFELAKKFKEHPLVCNAVGAHHEDIEMESPIAVLVQAADSISGARPGARRESLENYVKRLQKLEEIAKSFDGVGKTFAIQAGREIRVIVEPDKIDDIMADNIAESIAEKIEKEMEYPGQIKVTVVRERRSVSMAK